MKEYILINRCISTLKESRMDVITKLRIESLLSGIRVLLLVEQDYTGDLENLLIHVEEVCSRESADGVRGLIAHARNLQATMARA